MLTFNRKVVMAVPWSLLTGFSLEVFGQENTSAIKFSLRSIDAGNITDADVRGKVFVFITTSSRLPVRARQVASFRNLIHDYSPRGVDFYLVSTDRESRKSKRYVSDEQLRQFARELDLPLKVFADSLDVKRARQRLEQNERQEELQQWLRRLIERVRDGLERGLYQPIQIPDVLPRELVEDVEATEEDELVRPDFKCFRDLFLFKPQPGDVIWADDRFISRFKRATHAVPIISLNEVLMALRVRGILSETAYFEKLHRLRSGNFRYIPITKENPVSHASGTIQ